MHFGAAHFVGLPEIVRIRASSSGYAYGTFSILDARVVFQCAQNLIRTGHDLIVFGEAFGISMSVVPSDSGFRRKAAIAVAKTPSFSIFFFALSGSRSWRSLSNSRMVIA